MIYLSRAQQTLARLGALQALVLLFVGSGACFCSHAGQPPPIKVLFGGDTSFGESYGPSIRWRLEQQGYDRPLAGLRALMRSSDFVVLNLETPITDLERSPYEGSKTYIHWTDVRRAPRQLKKHGVRLVSLANNHAMDYGIEGLAQTLDILRRNRIDWVGAGLDQAAAERPYLTPWTARGQPVRLAVVAGFEYDAAYDTKYGFYARNGAGGACELSAGRLSAQLADLKADDPGLFVIVFPHWGRNYAWKTAAQTALARKLIDAGADLIIGHGGHRFQELEKYKGKWILYGLGNFMFNSQGQFADLKSPPYSLAAQLVLEERGGRRSSSMRLYPLLSDNRATDFQPRLLTPEEFGEAHRLLRERSPDGDEFDRQVTRGKDDLGWFLTLSLD